MLAICTLKSDEMFAEGQHGEFDRVRKEAQNPRIRYATSLPRLSHDRAAERATRSLALPIRSAQAPREFPAEDYG